MIRLSIVALLATSTLAAQRSDTTGAARLVLNAVRTTHAPRVDGRLDESEWSSAPVATNFVQRFPDPGVPATYQTQVRILYDDDAVYVGARMLDPHPDSIAAPLARRDPGDVSSDWFDVIFDSYNDRRTGYRFGVNPAGTRLDVYHFNDGDDDQSWDAFWDVATRIDSLGWTAEYRVPLSQLRFHGGAGEQVWGLNFYRAVARRAEWTFWSPYPPTAPGFVSAFGELHGLVGLSSASPVEVQPYVSSRVRTGGDFTGSPFRRGVHPGASAGADVRVGLGSGLSLSGAVNPDFGQVEVDPAVINLTTVETFFPEKRPFFLEGAGIFDFGSLPYVSSYGFSKLVHWRRIGRAPQLSPSAAWVDVAQPASILGASKLSGQLGKGWSIGVVDALTGRETVRIADSARVARRAVVEPMTNYFVGRVKRDFDAGRSTVGLIATSTNRSLDDTTVDALRANAVVAGFDATHYTSNRRWLFGTSVVRSRVAGGADAIAATQRSSVRYYGRPDASYLPFDPARRELTGHSASVGVVYRGNPWFGSLEAKEMSPGFESNDLGYLPRADVRALTVAFGGQHNSSRGLREARFSSYALEAWNFGGREIFRDFGATGSLRFPNFWGVAVRGDVYPSVFDDRLTRGGPTPRVPGRRRGSVSIESDSRRRMLGSAFVQVERKPLGGFGRLMTAALTLRPRPSLQMSLGPSLEIVSDRSQFVRAVADQSASATYGTRYVFATLDQRTLSADMRLDWTFSPDLSLQLYAQPFRAHASFSDYKELRGGRVLGYDVYGRDRGTVRTIQDAQVEIDPDGAGSARPFIVGGSPDESGFLSHARRVNAVLRREFRNGSVMYLVWQQSGDRMRSLEAEAPPSLWATAAPTNVLLAKFAYRFAR